jgi:hypothetical protein
MIRYYSHTQIGYLTTIVAGSVVAFLLSQRPRLGPISWGIIIALCVAMFFFSTLTIRITDESLCFFFNTGLYGRDIPLPAIASCRVVDTSIIEGWGIRSTPSGMLYNVSGTRAIEVRLRGGERFRIGSDQPDVVCERLRETIEKHVAPLPAALV